MSEETKVFIALIDPPNGDPLFFAATSERRLAYELANHFIEHWDECESSDPAPKLSLHSEDNEKTISDFLAEAYEWYIYRGEAEVA